MKEILFNLDKSLSIGLQLQLKEQLVSAILSHAIQPGERLPSSRKLSKYLEISRNTVTLVYQGLVDSGYLEPRARSGFTVSLDAPVISGVQQANNINRRSHRPQIDLALRVVTPKQKLHLMNKPLNWRDYQFPFLYGQADFKLFSHSDWRDCARQALGAKDFGSLAGDFGPNDDPLLVNYIARHSLPQRGIVVDPDQVLVTMGAQNALYLISELLINSSTQVVIEEPCYSDLLDIVQKYTKNITHIPVDEQGLVLDEDILSKCDLLFVTPSHQCPTTATMPIERRKLLLALAQKHDFLVVEDDYEFEMNFLAAASPALKSLDEEGRVLYVGSFSKSLFPGLRLGYLNASPVFIERARELRHMMLRHPPGHAQRTAAYFMALGYYDAQIHKLKRVYAGRRETMQKALDDQGLSNSTAARFGGTSFWIEGPKWLDSRVLARKLQPESVLIEPGSPFFADRDETSNCFRLAYSSIERKLIEEGIRRVKIAIDNLAP